MRIALIQTHLHWEQKEANRQMLSEKVAALSGQADLIVLPEMFTTGFSMNAAALAEEMSGPTVSWLLELARSAGAAMMGSFIAVEGGQFFNRLLFATPEGGLFHYDKRHRFSLAGEHLTYTAGAEQVVLHWRGWRIRPLICYDLRFPVWSRQPQVEAERYDLLVYIANWPVRRIQHWKSLLVARAIENQVYTAGVNIVGTDGNGHEYSGESAVIDYTGQTLASAAWSEQVLLLELDRARQQNYRDQFPFLVDADSFSLQY